MFSVFKVKKIEKQLQNIINNKSIDYEKAQNFSFEKDANEYEKNIYLFSASSQEKRQTIVLRLEIMATQSNIWVYYVEGYNRYYLEQIEYTQNCPLKITKEDNTYNIVFAGYLKKNNNKDLARLSLALKFNSDESYIDTLKHLNTNKISKMISKEKNNDLYFNDLQNNTYTQYHHFGKVKGKIIVEGQNNQIDLPCYNRHTFGKIDYSKINNNFTLISCNKENKFLYEMISSPSIDIQEVGLFKLNNQEYKTVNDIKYERQLLLKGSSPENLNILFMTNEEENIGIHGKRIDDIKYIIQEGEYITIIGVAEFLINGINYRGIYELGYNKDRSRWFNNKDISKIYK